MTIDENKIRYLENQIKSYKDTIVFVHGLGASAERWNGLIPFFEKKFRVVVPDLIGFGYSDKPLVDYTPEFFCDFFDKFVRKTNCKNPVIIGSSMGGQIVAEYAANNNSRVKKLVLVSPSGMMKESTPSLDAYIMAALYPNNDTTKNAFEMMEGSGNTPPQSLVEDFITRMQLPNAKMAFMSTLLGLKNADNITPKLQKITVPTLIIWGSEDPVIPIEFADVFVKNIKNSELVRIEKTGHTPYVQNPERFAKIILDFLKR